MKIHIVSIANRTRSDAFDALTRIYLERLVPYTKVEAAAFRNEQAFFEWVERQRSRTPPFLALLDSRGRQNSSEQFAEWLGRQRDSGIQTLVLAIGPADGWTQEARAKADALLSLGVMTLPHELVRVVLAEQLYRAFTILAGHPYHSGH
ncbi:MAG TPA: 23S rRNA (pseudouridine(1915)-N(3))-methyltransferase RlmH [Acidisarcina sp.]|nr:23S rRNA (pseudouridine(1915)-N(3))-methyltransferase RlmH [Acidisarcina sp.]